VSPFNEGEKLREYQLRVISKQEMNPGYYLILHDDPPQDWDRPWFTRTDQDGAPMRFMVNQTEYDKTQVGDVFYLEIRAP